MEYTMIKTQVVNMLIRLTTHDQTNFLTLIETLNIKNNYLFKFKLYSLFN